MKNIHGDLSLLGFGIYEARDLAQNRPLSPETGVLGQRYALVAVYYWIGLDVEEQEHKSQEIISAGKYPTISSCKVERIKTRRLNPNTQLLFKLNHRLSRHAGTEWVKCVLTRNPTGLACEIPKAIRECRQRCQRFSTEHSVNRTD